jgi:hypothetical protein
MPVPFGASSKADSQQQVAGSGYAAAASVSITGRSRSGEFNRRSRAMIVWSAKIAILKAREKSGVCLLGVALYRFSLPKEQ